MNIKVWEQLFFWGLVFDMHFLLLVSPKNFKNVLYSSNQFLGWDIFAASYSKATLVFLGIQSRSYSAKVPTLYPISKSIAVCDKM